MKSRFKYLIQIAILCLIYFLTAEFGLQISSVHKFAALIWPPTGIALVALMIFGIRLWPGIFAGAVLVNYATGAPFLVACGIGIGNTLEAVSGAWLCTALPEFDYALTRLRDTLCLIVRAALFSTLVSATLGVGSLWMAGILQTSHVRITWTQWWVGDVLGDLILAPLLLALYAPKKHLLRSFQPAQYGEAFLLAAAVLGLTSVVLGGAFQEQASALFGRNAVYILLPLLLWAATRFGQLGAVLTTFSISAVAIWNTSKGYGPFSQGEFDANLLQLMMFVLVLALTGLIVGAVVAESESAKHAAESAKHAAEHANAAKSAFLANMSHEIRTPLGAVLGFSELMLGDNVSVAERADYFQVIARNGQLLSSVINDILDLSKVEAGKLETDSVEVALDEIVQEIKALFKRKASEKGLGFEVAVEGPVPEFILTDPLRLRQILMNVIGNAIKFSSAGAVTVRISTRLKNNETAQLIFAVQDRGAGLSQEQAAKLFLPFAQADSSTTRKFGGTGLGLALSKSLALALGGDVVLSESVLHHGSTFSIYINCGDPKRAIVRSSTLPDRATPPEKVAESIKILVVDDSADNQTLIQHFLRPSGAQIELADNGKAGLAKALAGDFDLVLMDLQMPVMDGFEATRALRAQGYQKPVVALTAHAMDHDRHRTLEGGFDDHLTKPIDRKLLLKVVARYS